MMKKIIAVIMVLALLLSAGISRADFVFGKSNNLGMIVNSSFNDNVHCLSSDSLEMYFSCPRPEGYGDLDIWIVRRPTTEDDWSSPENLGSTINTPEGETAVDISHDGLTLYITSNRPGGVGRQDLWMATRASKGEPWAIPVPLGAIVNSPNNEWDPTISSDGLELYYTSDRPGGLGGYFGDVWITRRTSEQDPWGEPENILALNSTDSEGFTCISPDGLTFFLESERPGGYGNIDMWISRRPTLEDAWGQPINLGSMINTSYIESLGALAPNGRTLFFSSPRPPSLGGDFGDIWQTPIIPIVDFNGDGKVTGVEFSKVIDHWGQKELSCDVGPTPLGDGIVDVQDLITLAEYIGQDIVDPTLIAHWALDETEGNIAQDSAGENDSEVIGSAIWQPDDGVADGALLLDGVNDCLTTEYVRDPSDGSLSVFAWVKGGTPGQVIVSQVLGSNWLMADSSSGNLMTDLKESGRSGKALLSDTVITDGNWHRVGLVWDGTNRILCVDDVVVAADTQTELVGSNGGLNIGCDKNLAPGSFWSGLIDDVRIYNRAAKP